jgi:hypothetical protein
MQVATDTQGYQNYRRVGPERWLDDRSDNGGVVAAFRSEVEALIHQLLPSLLLLTSPPPLHRHRVVLVLVLVVLVIIGLSRVLQRCCQGLCGNTCACQAERLV